MIQYKNQIISLFAIALLVMSGFCKAASTTVNSISVLTIAPGKHLNDAFGHNAIRVKTDSLDLVYNYGVYDFNAPNFYTNFAKGLMYYNLEVSTFNDFINHYKQQNRAVKEQVLNLSDAEANLILNYLLINAQPEKKTYLYDFFYENCATKIGDVINNAIPFYDVNLVAPKNFQPKTFRDLIHSNLNTNSWGSFSIYLALGSIIDREASLKEHLFLPEYVYSIFKNSTLNNKPLVASETILFKPKQQNKAENTFFSSPLLVVLIVSLVILLVTYFNFKANTYSNTLDAFLFFITALIGIVLCWLWFGTNHTATAFNYNLLWAFPVNILAGFAVLKAKHPNWLRPYYKLLIILLVLMGMHWIIGVQEFSIIILPLIIALFIRFAYYIYYSMQHLTS